MSTPPPLHRDPNATPETRLARLEVLLPALEARMVERLNAGADRFGRVENAIGKLENAIKNLEPKPRSLLSYLGVLVTIVIFVGGIVWQAARYPDREEFTAAQAQQRQTTERLQADLSAVQRQQDDLRREVGEIQAAQGRQQTVLERVEGKLDRYLLRNR